MAIDLYHIYQNVEAELERRYEEIQREVFDRITEASEQYAVTAEEAANGMSELLRRATDVIGDKKKLDSSNDEEVDAFIL